MFKKLTETEVDAMIAFGKFGFFSNYGCVMNDNYKEVIVDARNGYYLVPVSEFQQDGFLVRMSASALLSVDGMPETETEILAREMNISVGCASDIV